MSLHKDWRLAGSACALGQRPGWSMYAALAAAPKAPARSALVAVVAALNPIKVHWLA